MTTGLTGRVVRLWRGGEGRPVTNLPQRIRLHSPDGFEWGYSGSGPADLALNVLEWALLEAGYRGRRVAVGGQRAFALALLQYHAFKSEVIATLPYGGGELTARFALRWLTDRAPSDPGLERVWTVNGKGGAA